MNSFWLSLGIAAAATAVVALLGIPLAARMARSRFPGQSAIDTLLTLPLVLPPTVVGYGIVVLFGSRGLVGASLKAWLDYTPLFRAEGAILAAIIVSFPLLYLPAKAAFRTIEPEMFETAALFGASRLQTFWHVSLPLASSGILSGALLCFARALGEFGATVMVFGWHPGRTTMPIAIYSAYEQGRPEEALPIVLALSATCFLLLLLLNRAGLRR